MKTPDIISYLHTFKQKEEFFDWYIILFLEENNVTNKIINSISNFINNKSNKELKDYIYYLYITYNEIFLNTLCHPLLVYNEIILDIHKYILSNSLYNIIVNNETDIIDELNIDPTIIDDLTDNLPDLNEYSNILYNDL